MVRKFRQWGQQEPRPHRLDCCAEVSQVVQLEWAYFPGLLTSVVLSKTRRGDHHSAAEAPLSTPAKDRSWPALQFLCCYGWPNPWSKGGNGCDLWFQVVKLRPGKKRALVKVTGSHPQAAFPKAHYAQFRKKEE